MSNRFRPFRPGYRQLTDEEKHLLDDIKNQAEVLEGMFDKVGEGRYKSLALTSLEESIMWIVKQVTA